MGEKTPLMHFFQHEVPTKLYYNVYKVKIAPPNEPQKIRKGPMPLVEKWTTHSCEPPYPIFQTTLKIDTPVRWDIVAWRGLVSRGERSEPRRLRRKFSESIANEMRKQM
jgi:hypothetical protein